jgi:type III secretion protein J
MQRTLFVMPVLALLLVSGCSVEIIHDVEESTANEVLAVLQRSGIDGEKIRSVQGSKATYTVAVPRGQAADAWKVLRRENLPRPTQDGLGEVFGKTGLVPTATQERALMHHALSGEMSRTLQSVKGVLEARVHLVLPARDPLAPPDAPQSPSKASVLLRVSGRCPLERKAVQDLVAGSVKDLKAEAVSVVIVKEKAGKPAAGAEVAVSSVGPFQVAASSRGGLLITLVVALVLVGFLGAVAIVLLRKNRRILNQLQQSRSFDGGGGTASRLDSSLSLIERSLGSRGSRATGEGRDRS